MSSQLVIGALEEGLIYGLVALGLLISYKILDIADMTTDGSFVLGGAVAAVMVMGGSPLLALPAAFVAGALAGLVTAVLQTRLGVPSILAGIITMTGLYTINFMVLGGKASLFYLGTPTVFTKAKAVFGERLGVLLPMILMVLLVGLGLVVFFTTQLGLSIRATGDNRKMVQASSINPAFTVTVGLCLANGLTALGGAFLSMRDSLGDVNRGSGVVVIGLASLVLGGVLFRSNKVVFGVLGAVVGSMIYRMIYGIAVKYADPSYLKIVSAAIVAVVIAYPTVKENLTQGRKRRRRKGHAGN